MRDVYVGSGSKSLSVLNKHAPALADKILPPVFFPKTKSEHPAGPLAENGLDHAAGELKESGGYEGFVHPVSVYTEATTHRVATAAVAGAAAAAVAVRRMTKNGG